MKKPQGPHKDDACETYRSAGVDVAAGERAVELMRRSVASTRRPEVIGDIGGFGGLFSLESGKYRQPVLVAATDGVGTKLKIAQALGRHDTVGVDLVAMCANDVVVQGAEPLFFLDYLAVGKLDPRQAAAIVEGVAEGCRQAGCALLGGETAEMPGFYAPGEYDVAGFCVGAVEKSGVVDGAGIVAGDVVLGLASSGLHSNGFSLVRQLVEKAGLGLDDRLEATGNPLGEELLTPTRIYVRGLLGLAGCGILKGAAHITGGGITGNIPRTIPDGLAVRLDGGRWPVPPIFDLLQELGHIADDEMRRTFNMGLGMAAVVAAGDEDRARRVLEEHGERVFRVGEVITEVAGGAKVVFA